MRREGGIGKRRGTRWGDSGTEGQRRKLEKRGEGWEGKGEEQRSILAPQEGRIVRGEKKREGSGDR